MGRIGSERTVWGDFSREVDHCQNPTGRSRDEMQGEEERGEASTIRKSSAYADVHHRTAELDRVSFDVQS